MRRPWRRRDRLADSYGKDLWAALERVVGGDIASVLRVVIDIRPGPAVIVHVERVADEQLIDVIRTLDGVQVGEIPREAARCSPG